MFIKYLKSAKQNHIDSPSWRFAKSQKILVWVFFLLLVFPACGLIQSGTPQIAETPNALLLQMTSLALTQTQLASQIQTAEITPTPAAILNEETPATEAIPVLEATPVPEDMLESSDPNLDLARAMKSAKILLFEDMSASRYLRYAKEALDRDEYFYQDVGSAKGWFKSQLLSSVEWDLVIAAAEARRDFGGEFFEYLDQQVEQGASVIVEYWDWDAAPNGKAQLLLERCGVSHQSDWYEPDLRVFFWLAPEHPVFFEPNQIPAGLRNAPALWSGDLGDLFRLEPGRTEQSQSAVLLAGTSPQYRSDHAILVSCVDGRVILQGFSSHEYAKEDMIALWQNYIYQTLKSRFALKPPYPAPAVTPSVAELNQPSAPPAALGQPAACGEALIARAPAAPTRQRDLFEHHAKGEFLLISLELENISAAPVQIYDQDYFLEGLLDGQKVVYQPDKAATGYLHIQNAGNLYQDLIQPGSRWRTNLAFDVNPRASDLVLVLRPGAEFQHQVCEVQISLELDYTQE
jgi:hypothetical protein